MRRVGIAVEQLDHVLRPLHEGVVDALARQHAAHRHGAGGDALGEGDEVGRDAVAFGGKRIAHAAEAGDHFVEDQEDAVLVADLAQPLEVALRRRQHAGRGRQRLDDDGGDGRGVVQTDDALQFVGQMRAPLRLADGEGLLGAVIGGLQMIDAGHQHAELLAVVDDAADRDAAEADAVIAALAADQPHARGVAAHVVIGERDLERGVDRLRAGIAEEHVVEIAGRQRGDAARQLEGLRVRELEGRRVVELARLGLDRFHDRIAIMARIGAPETGGAVDQLAPVRGEIVHVLGAGDEARPRLEGAVGRERHPEGFEIVGNGCYLGHGTPSLAASC